MWGRTLRIVRLAGFDIKVDASWLLIAGLIVWSLATGYFAQTTPALSADWRLLLATLAMLGLFASLIFHELAHALVARQFGVGTTGITLFLFGGVAELESEPKTPASEFKIAVVGPLASLFLALSFWVATHVTQELFGWTVAAAVFSYLAVVNLALALFNMVPAFPLDGGRVFRALLWSRARDLMQATRQAVMVSSAFSWLLIALGLMGLFAGQLAMAFGRCFSACFCWPPPGARCKNGNRSGSEGPQRGRPHEPVRNHRLAGPVLRDAGQRHLFGQCD